VSEQERRTANVSDRKQRVLVATGSAPIATITSLTSSFVTMLALCFKDLRGILLTRFMRRRYRDANRRVRS